MMLTLSAEKIGIRISNLRRRKKITQIELAEKMYISFQAVSNWERGQTMPDLTRIYELAQIFDVSVDEILSGQSESKSVENAEIKNNNVNTNMSMNMKGNSTMKFDEIKNAVEFMSQRLVDEIIENYLNQHQGEDDSFLVTVMEYASVECIERVKSSDHMKKVAENLLNEKGTKILWTVGQYLDKETVDNYVRNNCM